MAEKQQSVAATTERWWQWVFRPQNAHKIPRNMVTIHIIEHLTIQSHPKRLASPKWTTTAAPKATGGGNGIHDINSKRDDREEKKEVANLTDGFLFAHNPIITNQIQLRSRWLSELSMTSLAGSSIMVTFHWQGGRWRPRLIRKRT